VIAAGVLFLSACASLAGLSSGRPAPDSGGALDGPVDGADGTTGADGGGNDAEGDTSEGAPLPEAGLPSCPPCPATLSCVAAGCVSASTNTTTCAAPYDLPAGMDVGVIVCPAAEQVTACLAPGQVPAARLRLGGNVNGYNVVVSGTDPFVGTVDCAQLGSCSTSSSVTNRQFIPYQLIATGIEPASTSCTTLIVHATAL
jgi:hypothetical protein